MRRWQEREHPRDRRGRFAEKGEWVASLDAHMAAKLTNPGHPGEMRTAREPATGAELDRNLRVREITLIERRRLKPDRARQNARLATMRRTLDLAVDQRGAVSLEANMEDMRRRGIPENGPAWDEELRETQVYIARLDAQVWNNRRILEKAEKQDPPMRGTYTAFDLDQDIEAYGPLAPYGDMLHFDGSTYSAGILEALETVDPRFHRVVAEHMALLPNSGIYIGATRLTELDDLRSHLVGRPGGDWAAVNGATWDAVNGVYHYGSRTLGISLSENALHRGMGRATALHELGHALDDALKKISQAQEWYDIHQRIFNESTRLSPHFNRDNAAGRSELWAESFLFWHAWQDDRDGFLRAYADEFSMDRSSSTVASVWDYFQRVSEQLG